MMTTILVALVNVAFVTITSTTSLAAAIGHVHISKHIVGQDKNNMNFSGTTSVLNIINSTSNPDVINNTASGHSNDSGSVSGPNAFHQGS